MNMLNWVFNLMHRLQPQKQQSQGTPSSSPSTGERWRHPRRDAGGFEMTEAQGWLVIMWLAIIAFQVFAFIISSFRK